MEKGMISEKVFDISVEVETLSNLLDALGAALCENGDQPSVEIWKGAFCSLAFHARRVSDELSELSSEINKLPGNEAKTN